MASLRCLAASFLDQLCGCYKQGIFGQLFKMDKILLLLHAKLGEVIEETDIFLGIETLELGKVATRRYGRSDTCL